MKTDLQCPSPESPNTHTFWAEQRTSWRLQSVLAGIHRAVLWDVVVTG